MHHGECNLECLTRTAGAGKRRSERNSCKSGESSGDMARRLSKIRWNLGEKANAPEELAPQLVIRRFLPAFMRPCLAVFIGKIFSPWYTLGEPAKIWYSREPISCALLHPPVLLLPPAANALASRPYARALSSSLIEYSPLYLRMPVEIYRLSRCSFRFNLLRPALTSSLSFPSPCSPTSCASNVISFPSSAPVFFFF